MSHPRTLFPLVLLAAASQAQAWQTCDGCTPINDLGTGLYLGTYEGGLYSGGLNVPPPAHVAAANAASTAVVPRDAAGTPHADGSIGFISISMSNCNQEFSAFERRADRDDHRGAQVKIVNGCQGGQALNAISSPGAEYWSNLAERVDAGGLSPEQVQVVWIKMCDGSVPSWDFPDHALTEMASAQAVLQILKSTYPNLGLAFFSSRIYGGNSPNPTRGEPVSYETGFAVKWLIEEQIAGAPGLNYDPGVGPVLAPLILWGPYLWANGTIPRSDGLVWLPGDFEADGVHPSADGEQKVAGLLEDFFQFDPHATRWYGKPTRKRLVTLDATGDAGVDGSQPSTNFGSETSLAIADHQRRAYVKFDLAGIGGILEQAKLSFVTPPNFTSMPGAALRGVSDTSWDEATITFANAPAMDGALLGQLPLLSRGTATSFDVTSDVLANWGGLVSFGLASAVGLGDPKQFLSREGGEAPRLVLTMRPPCDDPSVPYCRSLPNSTGASATLSTSGGASIADNDLVLLAIGMPPSVPALFYYGPFSRQIPFGEGLRCVGGGIARLNPPVFVGPGGDASRAIDFEAAPLGAGPSAVQAGDTVHFQCWHRDPGGGPAGFNLTDAVQVVICP